LKYYTTRSFKNQLVIILTISTFLPAVFLSGILLLQITEDAKESVKSKLELIAKSDSAVIQNRMAMLGSRLQQLALDQNIVLAAENSVFSVTARGQMALLLEAHPELAFVQLYDTEFWPVESVPSDFEFMPMESVLKKFQYIIPIQGSPQFTVFDSPELKEMVSNQANIDLSSSEFLTISVKLLKQNEANPQQAINTGFLIAVVALPNLLTLLDESEMRRISIAPISSVGLEQNQPIIVQAEQLNTAQQPFYFAVESLRDNFVKPINRAVIKVALIILVVLVVSIFVALYVSKRFTRPMSNISLIVESYRTGELNKQLPSFYFSEFQQLSTLLNDMASQLNKNQKELESRVELRTSELAKANTELKVLLKEQKALQTHLVETEKMAQLGGLVAGIAHEINTPVGIGMTAASSVHDFISEIESSAQSGKLTKSQLNSLIAKSKECTAILVSNLTRSAELISNFKEVAVSQVENQKNIFKVKIFIAEIISSLLPQTRKFDIDYQVDIPEGLELRSYQGVFAQIITNLIINSTKHGFTDTSDNQILIAVVIKKEALVLSYQDNGVGMSDEIIKKIFEPFYTTKRGKGGTGLGMHIVFNLVTQKLGGQIKVQSKPNKGTKVMVTIPKSHLA
jgi:signal transduction histidine kinase